MDNFALANEARRWAMKGQSDYEAAHAAQTLIGCDSACPSDRRHAHVVVGGTDFAEDEATGEVIAVRHLAHEDPF